MKALGGKELRKFLEFVTQLLDAVLDIYDLLDEPVQGRESTVLVILELLTILFTGDCLRAESIIQRHRGMPRHDQTHVL